MLIAAGLVLLCGVAIGATSIGGVGVVPALEALAQIPVATAVAAASFGFGFPGVAALIATRRAGAAGGESWSYRLPLATLAGAAVGALTLAWLPGSAMRLGLGALCVGSGLYTLAVGQRGHRGQPRAASDPGGAVLALLGLTVGCLSAWSGTGGPVVLLPLLALLGWSAAKAVAAAQLVQLPVALAATAVHAAAGRLDWALGAMIGLLVLAGWAIGRRLARGLPERQLQTAVAVALVLAGGAYLLRG